MTGRGSKKSSPLSIKTEERQNRANEELEKKIAERTAELARANALLRREIEERKHAEEALRESESNFRALADRSPTAIFIVQGEKFIYINKNFTENSGYTLEDLATVPFWSILDPEMREQLRSNAAGRQQYSDGTPRYYELKIITKSGEEKIVDVGVTGGLFNARPAILGTVVDLTECKHAEETLRESQGMQARAQAMAHVGHWDRDLSTQKVRWSDETYRIFGLKPRECEVDGPFLFEHIHPDDRERVAKAIRDAADGVKPYDELYRPIRPDGNIRWVHAKGEVMRSSDGKPARIFGTILDITERKQIEEALRSNEEAVTAILNASPETIFLIDTSGIVLAANEATAHRLGAEPSEMIGRCIYDFLPSEVVRTRKEAGEEVIRTGRPVAVEDVRMGRYFNSVVYPVFNEAGQVARLVIYADDVTERKQMEEELRRSRDELELRVAERTAAVTRLAAAVENAAEAIIITDPLWRIQYVNAAFSRCTGYASDEVIGRDVGFLRSESMDLATYDRSREMAMLDRPFASRRPMQRKDGSEVVVECVISCVKNPSGEVMNFTMVCRDVSEQLHLEAELRQSQKMEAIGTLAGGIAHDFNNMLAVIIGNAELAAEDVQDEAIRGNLAQILNASKRSRDLVKQILTFSRRGGGKEKVVKFAPVVEETYELLRASLPSTIHMELKLRTKADTATLADPSRIQQVIVNLANNAAYAMREKGGNLTIEVSTVAAPNSPYHEDAGPKRYVKLTVKDTGGGIAPEVQKRMFDPFFTTKEEGQGTGMGLAVVYGIVKRYGGNIEVQSEVGKGSRFTVLLPQIDAFLITEEEKDEEMRSPSAKEHVLFVDDEPAITHMAKTMLERLGYRVTAVTESSEALKLFNESAHEFDLVVTDQTMPDMTGIALARKMLAIKNDLPIILCTGYSEMVSPDKAREVGIREFVMKPITKKEMAEAIRRVLERGDVR